MKRVIVLFGVIGVVVCVSAKDLRDPFMWSSKKSTLRAATGIVLEGVVYSGTARSAAVLSCGSQRAIIERGKKFAGYTLLRIGKKFVELVRGKEKKKIFIE